MNALGSPARLGLGLLVCALSYFQIFVSSCPASPDGKQVLQAQDLRLVPFPKIVVLESNHFALEKPLTFEISDNIDDTAWKLVNAELKRAGLPEAQFRPLKTEAPMFRLGVQKAALFSPQLPPQPELESYALEVRANEVVGAAKDAAGLFCGVQTLCQLIRANRLGPALPCLKIQDWPSLRWRCFQDDLTRGPSSTLDTLKFEASLGSNLKLNLMTYYMEYQFAFKKHPKVAPANGSLTAEELKGLVLHAKPLHVDILGNQQSFGHFGQILKYPEYAGLRETEEVLTPVRDETYGFLDDLYSEVCPLLPFPWFNVCCDETDGLGTGPSKELAAKSGVGAVYVGHIQRVHDLLRDRHGKRMMMWGDIILQHPEQLARVPKDTIMLTWGYDNRVSFEEQILPFSRSGFEFFVCPGVSDWSRILPDFGVAITNIHNFVRDGIKHGAMGMINTDWEDDGEALKAVKWHADAWAAECAWNGSATRIEDFNRRIGGVLFGEQRDDFGRAVELLARTHRLRGMNSMFNARFWERDFRTKGATSAIQAIASNLLATVQPALAHLQTCRQEAKCNEHILEVFQLGARRMELIGQRMLDGLEASRRYEQVRNGAGITKLAEVQKLVRKNRDAHEELGRQFAALWLSESKPYALDWTLARYTNLVKEYDELLSRLESARKALETGESLPPVEEIGLAAPKENFRGIRLTALAPESLSPELPWLEPGAPQRLGLVVEAGAQDRYDIPIELQVLLPTDLAGRPSRAFLLSSNAAPQEVLVQIDRVGTTGKVRLVMLLPGPLPRGTAAVVQVYLGLAEPPKRLQGAVTIAAETGGMIRVENDQIRLLLGPEGGHVYRWEVKSAAGRDLTMPGETDWAGFDDVYAHRKSEYELDVTARGPAMVEIECNEAWGHSKVLRIYGKTSWLETLLSEPCSMYWDYDNPKNFAADGPTPGQWLFSDGKGGFVGREADGLQAQVKGPNTFWGVKYNADGIGLGLTTPENAVLHVIAPGAGAGGVGIEGSHPARHFVTFGGLLPAAPAEVMNRLQTTLDLDHPVTVRLHALQPR